MTSPDDEHRTQVIYAAVLVLLAVTISFLCAASVMGVFGGGNQFPVEGRTVVITGGSQGMGRGLGKLLARKGANIVIVARSQDKLIKAVEYISSHAVSSKQRFHWISADLTKPEENARLLTEVTAWNNGNPPDIVWANAGSAHPSLFLDTELSTLREQMETNYWAAAYLAHETLKTFLKSDATSKDKATASSNSTLPRHFIMTSSVIAFAGLTGYAPYGPAKAALRNLADCLKSEVNLYRGARKRDPANAPPTDVEIHCVFPGTILSPGLEQENLTKPAVTKLLEETDIRQTEDEVAAAAVKGLEKGQFLITTQIVGGAMRASMLGGSPKNNWVVDTLFAWVASIVWLFVGPDLTSKVYNYGKKNGVN